MNTQTTKPVLGFYILIFPHVLHDDAGKQYSNSVRFNLQGISFPHISFYDLVKTV